MEYDYPNELEDMNEDKIHSGKEWKERKKNEQGRMLWERKRREA
jgi:hypothetical protein